MAEPSALRKRKPRRGDQRGSSSAVRGWGSAREPSLPTQQQFHLFVPYIRKPIRPSASATYISGMLFERMRRRLAADTKFIEPCLPSPADNPPSGSNWVHQIKHDGFRLMARRDPVGIRLITRRGNNWTARYPLVVEAVNHLKVRSCLIDSEVVCSSVRALAAHRRQSRAYV